MEGREKENGGRKGGERKEGKRRRKEYQQLEHWRFVGLDTILNVAIKKK
jgi:hypothetical protein